MRPIAARREQYVGVPDAPKRYRSRLGLLNVFAVAPLVISGCLAAGVVAATSDDWYLVLFPAVIAAAVFVDVYFRTAIELEINGSSLAWRAPFRRGVVESREVAGTHLSWLRQSLIIEVRNQPPIAMWRGPRLRQWLDRWGFLRR